GLVIAAGPAGLSVAALRISTSPRPAVTSAIKGISAAGVSCRALVTASMTTTTGAATAIPITPPTAAIRPRTTSRGRGAAHHECQDEKVESMITRFAMATAAVLLGCSSAYAQARMNVSPLPALGMTSPLGIPNAPVGQTGIPLGATELATPGVSPTASGAAPLIGAPCAGASACVLTAVSVARASYEPTHVRTDRDRVAVFADVIGDRDIVLLPVHQSAPCF